MFVTSTIGTRRAAWPRARMKISRRTILILFAPLACAPGGSDETRLHTVSRDSAGIRIIENAKPPEGSRMWQVGPEPSVSIGEREGGDPYMLHQARDATKLDDGRILVANGGDDELRVFDACVWGGRDLAGELGRPGRGEGPGEFGDLSHVESWARDSIVAWSGPGSSILVFDSEGNFGPQFHSGANP